MNETYWRNKKTGKLFVSKHQTSGKNSDWYEITYNEYFDFLQVEYLRDEVKEIEIEISHIEFEDKNHLEKWIEILHNEDKNIISDIPYSFFEIQRELIRRENLDLK